MAKITYAYDQNIVSCQPHTVRFSMRLYARYVALWRDFNVLWFPEFHGNATELEFRPDLLPRNGRDLLRLTRLPLSPGICIRCIQLIQP